LVKISEYLSFTINILFLDRKLGLDLEVFEFLNVDSKMSDFIDVKNRIRKQNIDLRAFKIGEYFNRSMFGEFKMIMSNHQLNITDI